MPGFITKALPHSKTRSAGAVYLLYFLTAVLGEFLAAHGFAAYGFAVNLIAAVCYAAVTLLLYVLFKPVHKGLSLIALLFGLAGCAITILDLFSGISFHGNPLLFFGPYCALIGYLILKSTFMPRTLGVLLMLAGIGWLAFAALPLTKYLVYGVESLGFLAEAALMLWLLVAGADSNHASTKPLLHKH